MRPCWVGGLVLGALAGCAVPPVSARGAAPRATGASGDAPGALRYRDDDGDGFGDASKPAPVADAGARWVAGDCDDARADVHPGAFERCDGLDDDCDGLVDEDFAWRQPWLDVDGDGLGDHPVGLPGCIEPAGVVWAPR